MVETTCAARIDAAFRKQVQSDRRVRGAYLLVQSEKLGVDLNIAESGDGSPVHVEQPIHLASVGKLFTATLIAKLYEAGKLDFSDKIGDYLDAELMRELHVYRGHEYSTRSRSGICSCRHSASTTSSTHSGRR